MLSRCGSEALPTNFYSALVSPATLKWSAAMKFMEAVLLLTATDVDVQV